MKFGAQVSCYRNTWDSIRKVAQTMDAGPWNSIWFADHFIPPPGKKEEEHLTAHEAFSVAAAVAALTTKLEIGHLVVGNTYRNPALVAKIAGTIDHIAGGRFILGIGAAWFKREHEAYGWEFPSMKERQDRFEEATQLIRSLLHLGEGSVSFKGKYYTLDDAFLSPGSLNQPIPILVGGTGPKRTLRTLARYGDVMNLDGWAGGPMTAAYFKEKIDILNRHCEEAGRDPSEIRHTVLIPTMVTDDASAAAAFIAGRRLGEGSAAGPRSYVLDRIGEMIEAGAEEIMIGGIPTDDLDQLQLITEDVVAAFT